MDMLDIMLHSGSPFFEGKGIKWASIAILTLKKLCRIGGSSRLLRNNTRHLQSGKPGIIVFYM